MPMPMSVEIDNCEIGATCLQLPSDFCKTVDLFFHHKHLSFDEISCGAINPLKSLNLQDTYISMSESRIKKFLQLSREGPNFVCIICK